MDVGGEFRDLVAQSLEFGAWVGDSTLEAAATAGRVSVGDRARFVVVEVVASAV